MDPVTAIGVASSIIAFVEFGAQILKRLEELSQAGDVPKVFRDVRTRLPLILQIVERARDGARDLNPETQQAVEEIVRNCHEHVEKLEKILQSVTVRPNDSRWRRGAMAITSLIQEDRVERIASVLKGNIDLLTSLNISPAEKSVIEERRSSIAPPPAYALSRTLFHVPFERDDQFVGRAAELDAIKEGFNTANRVSVVGIGGVGKSQVAIEFCYRHREAAPSTHVFWVWGGNAARFKQDYKRIAKAMNLSGWDDSETNVLQLVSDWLSEPLEPYLLVIDNADNMKDWWPSKYASMVPNDSKPSDNLVEYLPDCGEKGRMLITTRDSRIASRLARQIKPVTVQPMHQSDAQQLFISRTSEEYTAEDVNSLVHQLDFLPLAISQAAAYLAQHGYYSIGEYLQALETDEAEEFLHEELDDDRRHQDSVNSVFKTWKLSFDQVRTQKSRAADLLCMMSMLDRQSIPKFLLTSTDEFKSELATALGTLHAFHLILLRANKVSFQLHRLVRGFVVSHMNRARTIERWRAAALKCVVNAYPTEIGPAEHELCETLTPHVLALISHEYATDEANLDLATLLCWSADFAIERNEFSLATTRAQKSLNIFQRFLPESDIRMAAASWLCGRLAYYQASSDEDMTTAAEALEEALRISAPKTMTYAESAFELAHLYFDQGQENKCLRMGKASYECWKQIEGADSHRALDALHDYALELALFGHEEDAVAKWKEILRLSLTSRDSSENTRRVFELRSIASIAEFSNDASMAEDIYQKLIVLCGAIYSEYHIHVFDYRLCHSEQVLRQGRLQEAADLAHDILLSCQHSSEWQIHASSLQISAECSRLQGDLLAEQEQRVAALELLEKSLNRTREDTIAAIEGLAHCFTRAEKFDDALLLWEEIMEWREKRLSKTSSEYFQAVLGRGVCLAGKMSYDGAEKDFTWCLEKVKDDLISMQNLCIVLARQDNWETAELHCLEFVRQYEDACSSQDEVTDVSLEVVRRILHIALSKQGREDAVLENRVTKLEISEHSSDEEFLSSNQLVLPALPQRKRFGRMIHPRSWSA